MTAGPLQPGLAPASPIVHHVLNSSLVSGPETLVLPNLQGCAIPCELVLLQESRRRDGPTRVAAFARELGFTVHEISVARRLDPRTFRVLRTHWNHHRPSIIHAHGPKASFYSTMSQARTAERPWLLTTHHGVRANDQSAKLRFYEYVYEKLVIPRTDLCLTVCTSDRELLIKRGVAPEKLDLHLNGIDRPLSDEDNRVQAARNARKAWSDSLGIDLCRTHLVGVVGRLSPEKQHGLILESFSRFVRRSPESDAHLLCFGSGPLERVLKERTASLGQEDRVHWMGYHPDIARHLPGLDVLLSVSSAEGLPINLIEAGWARLPVIANGVDGIRDLIQHERTGILIEPPPTAESVARALEWVTDNPVEASRMAGYLQSVVRSRFSKEAWCSRLRQIYGRFLSDM